MVPLYRLPVCSCCWCELVDDIVVPTACGHAFHEKCLKQWERTKRPPKCPVCRADFCLATTVRVLYVPTRVEGRSEDDDCEGRNKEVLEEAVKAQEIAEKEIFAQKIMVDDLQRELARKKKKLAERTDALRHREKQLSDIRSKSKELESSFSSLESEVKEYRQQREILERIEKGEIDDDLLDPKKGDLKAKLLGFKKEFYRFRKEIQYLQYERRMLRDERQKWKLESASWKNRNLRLQQENEVLQEKISSRKVGRRQPLPLVLTREAEQTTGLLSDTLLSSSDRIDRSAEASSSSSSFCSQSLVPPSSAKSYVPLQTRLRATGKFVNDNHLFGPNATTNRWWGCREQGVKSRHRNASQQSKSSSTESRDNRLEKKGEGGLRGEEGSPDQNPSGTDEWTEAFDDGRRSNQSNDVGTDSFFRRAPSSPFPSPRTCPDSLPDSSHGAATILSQVSTEDNYKTATAERLEASGSRFVQENGSFPENILTVRSAPSTSSSSPSSSSLPISVAPAPPCSATIGLFDCESTCLSAEWPEVVQLDQPVRSLCAESPLYRTALASQCCSSPPPSPAMSACSKSDVAVFSKNESLACQTPSVCVLRLSSPDLNAALCRRRASGTPPRKDCAVVSPDVVQVGSFFSDIAEERAQSTVNCGTVISPLDGAAQSSPTSRQRSGLQVRKKVRSVGTACSKFCAPSDIEDENGEYGEEGRCVPDKSATSGPVKNGPPDDRRFSLSPTSFHLPPSINSPKGGEIVDQNGGNDVEKLVHASSAPTGLLLPVNSTSHGYASGPRSTWKRTVTIRPDPAPSRVKRTISKRFVSSKRSKDIACFFRPQS